MPKLMLGISSRCPNAKGLLDKTAQLAASFKADWFVVHVRQRPTLHYRMAATEHPVPDADLAYAKKLGARVIVETGEVLDTLLSFARKMSITHFVTGRSVRSRVSFTWRLPLAEEVQRNLPEAIVIIV